MSIIDTCVEVVEILDGNVIRFAVKQKGFKALALDLLRQKLVFLRITDALRGKTSSVSASSLAEIMNLPFDDFEGPIYFPAPHYVMDPSWFDMSRHQVFSLKSLVEDVATFVQSSNLASLKVEAKDERALQGFAQDLTRKVDGLASLIYHFDLGGFIASLE